MDKDSAINPYFSNCLEQYSSVKNDDKEITLRTTFDELASDEHLSLRDVINAAETLDRAGFKVTIHVTDETKGGNADE